MNAMLVGFTRYEHKNLQHNKERAASVERESSSDEVESRTSVDGTMTEDLFDDSPIIQEVLTAGDATVVREDAQEA